MSETVNEHKLRVKRARGKFAAMACTYFAGVFNDNFFRESSLMLAVATGSSFLQGPATIIFTAPFLLFAAWAGYAADRFRKRHIVIFSKILELIAMVIAAVGLITLNWYLIMTTLFIMATQSTLFGPALNGTIPELYPPDYVLKANAIIRTVSTTAILLGTAVAGVALDIKGVLSGYPLARITVGLSLVCVSVSGVIVSLFIPSFDAADVSKKFPKLGPFHTLNILWKIRRDKMLATVISAKAFFWFIGSLTVLIVNPLGIDQLGFSKTLTSALKVAELLGIAAGAALSMKITAWEKWYRVLSPSALALAFCMAMIRVITMFSFGRGVTAGLLIVALGGCGIAGGIYMIPLASFVQVRPASTDRGTTIAASSFADFTAIALGGVVYWCMNSLGITPANDFLIMAGMVSVVAVWLVKAFSKAGKWEAKNNAVNSTGDKDEDN